MELIVQLTLPPKELSPNARTHWARKARAAKKYKAQAHVSTMVMHAEGADWSRAKVRVKMWNRTKHRWDGDNLLSAMKSAFDGIAEALGVDDKEWTHLPCVQDTDPDDPRVEVLLYADGASS